MTNDSMSPGEARAALNSVDVTRAKLAAIGECPPWRHAAFGAVMGLLVLAIGLEPPVQFAVLAIATGGVSMIASYDRKHYGVFVNGFRKGATWLPTAALIVAILGLLLVQHRLGEAGGAKWVPFAVASIAAIVGTISSVWWNRVFRREMVKPA